MITLNGILPHHELQELCDIASEIVATLDINFYMIEQFELLYFFPRHFV